MHLVDQSCHPHFRNSTHVSIRAPLYGCGTRLNVTEANLVFFNWFIAKAKVDRSQLVSFFPDVEISFHCTYGRKQISTVSAPLALDKRHSSPEEVKTFYGLTVSLKCAFKHGAPPVHVAMYHEGKLVTSQESGLQLSHTAGRWSKDYGLYTCVAKDANQNAVRYNIKLKKVDPKSISTEGVQTTCTPEEMHIKLSRVSYPWLQPDYFHMHLLDPACRPYHVNTTHTAAKTAYGACGTVMVNSSYGTTYQNVFKAVVRALDGAKITRVPDVHFPFKCGFDAKLKTMIPIQVRRDIIYPSDLTPLLWGLSSYGLVHYAVYNSGSLVRVLCHVDKLERFIGWEDEEGRSINQWESRVRAQGLELVINNLTVTDGGLYKCRTDQRFISLNIYVAVELSAFPVKYILQGNDDVVSCSVIGYPKPSVYWRKGAKRLKTKGRFTVTEDGSLRVKNAKLSDSGNYGCFAEQYINDHGGIKTRKANVRLYVYESLTVNKSRSTPSIVRSYSGFDVRVMCTFQGGVPPINLTLTKRGIRLTRGVVVRGRILYGVIKTRHGAAAFGSYECLGRDAKGSTVKHRFHLIKSGPRDFTSEGMTVTCNSRDMDVRLNRLTYPWLDRKNLDLHLSQSNCTPYNVTDIDIRIQAPLRGCGTRNVQKNKDVVEFHNMFIARVKPVRGSLITYLPDTYFLFYCAYERTFPGKIVLQPIRPLTVDTSKSTHRSIISPQTLDIKLRCVFTGGEPPIKISLLRNRELISRAQGRNLSLVLKPPHAEQHAGNYVCKASDARNMVASHEITVNIPDRGVLKSNSGIDVHCGSRHTLVTLNREMFPWLHAGNVYMHLNDPICKPRDVNSTHVLFKIPPGSCGSRHITTPKKLVFFNRVLILEKRKPEKRKPGDDVSQKPILEIPFQCKYRRISSVNQKLK